ncbi:translesion DNA synthesis-associated protein ImuA [Enterovibrio norvegicus]|uniref:translesion DNA synthesis-associated protein ImuA n=1 Tax=Enterovibrio norvegicus TaxID=188144 RepID=UPI000C85851D|nr:translesion DNA synthesis-associated protein ImuA [Enterovibrio norvegicus]PMI32283.1 recombinase RecA [Enterovibrio norvegicus]TKF13607.1 translesion DNA synthesis-associated protein ImuA [Enterovibrio norvegicus]
MLDNLLALHSGLWTANRLYQPQTHCRPSGFALLDEKLEGGWPESGVVELQLACFGVGELRLVLPAIATALKDSELTLFACPPGDVNPVALCQAGIDLDKVVVLASSADASLWCVEQALKSGCCRTAVLWGDALSVTQARRLQLAATENDCLLFMITHKKSVQGLPVSCRLALTPSDSGIAINVVKRRGLPVQPFTLTMPAMYTEHHWSSKAHSITKSKATKSKTSESKTTESKTTEKKTPSQVVGSPLSEQQHLPVPNNVVSLFR